MKFYDTCALLNMQEAAFQEPFAISSVTLREIETIKTAQNKDEDVKWRARNITRLLRENPDQFTVKILYGEQAMELENYLLPNSPDNLIVLSAHLYNLNTPITFVTDDLLCAHIAKHIFKLPVESSHPEQEDEYTGYKEIVLDDDGLATLYESPEEYTKDLLENEYLAIYNVEGELISLYRRNGTELVKAYAPKVESREFGKIKPLEKDVYQTMALDSFANNKITMIRGAAGTGKTYLALGYLFSLLEKGKIDKIIVFCNTVPTLHSAKIGFLPGTRDEKLLESSTGNMLSAKLGDSYRVQQLISSNKLLLLPFCDIRGYDTNGKNAGILISEAQNADVELLKLGLQRIGDDCICIVDGDYNAQVDDMSFAGAKNGMRRMSEVFRGYGVYGEVKLQNIYRSEIARIAEMM